MEHRETLGSGFEVLARLLSSLRVGKTVQGKPFTISATAIRNANADEFAVDLQVRSDSPLPRGAVVLHAGLDFVSTLESHVGFRRVRGFPADWLFSLYRLAPLSETVAFRLPGVQLNLPPSAASANRSPWRRYVIDQCGLICTLSTTMTSAVVISMTATEPGWRNRLVAIDAETTDGMSRWLICLHTRGGGLPEGWAILPARGIDWIQISSLPVHVDDADSDTIRRSVFAAGNIDGWGSIAALASPATARQINAAVKARIGVAP